MKRLVEDHERQSTLARWRGAKAQVWIFDPTLTRLGLLVHREAASDQGLYIVGVNCGRFRGPFRWENTDICLDVSSSEEPKRCRLYDVGADFDLTCGSVVLVVGRLGDNDRSFNGFLPDDEDV